MRGCDLLDSESSAIRNLRVGRGALRTHIGSEFRVDGGKLFGPRGGLFSAGPASLNARETLPRFLRLSTCEKRPVAGNAKSAASRSHISGSRDDSRARRPPYPSLPR